MKSALAVSSLRSACLFVVSLLAAFFLPARAAETPLRAGMIGLDTSHVPAFAKFFNEGNPSGGIRIVAGYPGGTDLPSSKNRVAGYTEQLRKMGIEIVDSIPALLQKVDVVLLESVDGRIHWQEAVPVLQARKPVFIDKPVAGSLVDAIAIYELAKRYNVPVFSSSSLRFVPGVQELRNRKDLGDIIGAITWYTCNYQEGIPDMYFYGIHGIEPLFALMGAGCETVARTQTRDTDVVTGTWKDGRIGTYRGIRKNKSEFGAVAFGTKGIAEAPRGGQYDELDQRIVEFFQTRVAPVSAEETIELFAFMEAADESKRQGGAPVAIAPLLAKARQEAAAKVARVGP